MRRSESQTADVAVIGCGPAGSAVALELRRLGRSVIVIEKSGYEGVRVGETLPPAVEPLLRQLGVWQTFLADEHSRSFGICSAWGHDNLDYNDFMSSIHGAGWHVDRARFDAMLARAAESAGASMRRRTSLRSCERSSDLWKIEFTRGNEKCGLRTRFVVDASGRTSHIARKLGARRVTYDRLIGIAFFFAPDSRDFELETLTLIEASEDGWWYSALLPQRRLVVVYMTDADLYARDHRRSGDTCLGKLGAARHTCSRIKYLTSHVGPFVFSASSSCLERAAGTHWLAVGDAAMALDPLSGQGVYKALAEGLRSAEAVHAHLDGNQSALSDYAATVKRDFSSYLRIRGRVYSMQRRWGDSLFWQRRTLPTVKALPQG